MLLFQEKEQEFSDLLQVYITGGNEWGNRLERALEKKKERWAVLSNEEIDLLNICLDAKLKITESTCGEGEDNKVCRGIEEYAAKRKAEGKAEGVLTTLLQLVRDGLLALPIGAERAGMSEEAFEALLADGVE